MKAITQPTSCFTAILAQRRCWVRCKAWDNPQPDGCTNRLHLTGIKCHTELFSHTPEHNITFETREHGADLSLVNSSRDEKDAHWGPNGEVQKFSHWRAFSSRYTQGADLSACACDFPVIFLLHPVVWKCWSPGADRPRWLFTNRDAVSTEDFLLRFDS